MVALELLMFIFFFFFQAEDGIRDLTVTGVQTCALPISPHLSRGRSASRSAARLGRGSHRRGHTLPVVLGRDLAGAAAVHVDREILDQIGRASCRERV